MAGQKETASKLHKLRKIKHEVDNIVQVKSEKAVFPTAVLPKVKTEQKNSKSLHSSALVSPSKCRTVREKRVKEKAKREKLNKRERRLLKLKSKKHSELIRQLLPLFEEFRCEDTLKEKCFEKIEEVLSLSKDKMVDLCMAHDTARIIESAVQRGTEAQRWRIFAELKKSFCLLSKSRYAKFVVLKLIKYGEKEHRLEIIKAFRNRFARLVNHRLAAEVVELLYNDYANATQRAQILQELYGSAHALNLNDTDVHAFANVLQLNPEKRSALLSNLCRLLTSLVKKGLTKHSIVQHLLLEYLHAAGSKNRDGQTATGPVPMEVEGDDPVTRQEQPEADETVGSNLMDLLDSLVNGHIVPMLHTREGVRASLYALRACPVKLRKTLVRSMKTCVGATARSEHGHLFLIGLLDSVDDIQLVNKYIIKEIREELQLFVSHPEARKVLLYALSPRDTRHFSPQLQASIFNILNDSPFTKKPLGVRAMELRTSSTCNLLLRLLQLAATEEGLMKAFIGPVGDRTCGTTDLVTEDRGRIVLLTEMLLRSAPHHLDPARVVPMYSRSAGAVSPASTAPGPPEAELRQLAELRLTAFKCLVGATLAAPFEPVQRSDGEGDVGQRSSVDRDALRMKRHRQATLRADAVFTANVKPSFASFGSTTEADATASDPAETDHQRETQPTAFLERPEGQLMMRRLLQDGHKHGDFTLSQVIFELVPIPVIQSWTQCNRGCFLLVNLWELGDSALSGVLKRSLKMCIPQLKSSWHPGAKVLLKHVKNG